MRNSLKRKISAATVLLLLLSTIHTGLAFGAVRSSEQAQTQADLLVEGYGVTSVQYALIEDGEITVSGTSGVYSKESPLLLQSSHMYAIGSISKIYTAASVMMLVDEGKIDLDQPVVTYIPEFEMADPRYKQITVRMLLNHSSGLLGSSLANSFLFNDSDTIAHDKLLDNLKTQPLKAEPGAYSVYCNDGFTLAEIVVERVSGMTFTQFIDERFATPLKLVNTKTPQSAFDRAQLSRVYYPTIETALPVESANVIGTGGIYSTAEELCRMAQIFMKDTGGNNLLSSASVNAMAQKEYRKGLWTEGEGLLSFGLGWDSVTVEPFEGYGIQALVKGGDTVLSHGSLVVVPEHNMAAAVLSVGSASTYDQMVAEALLLEALQQKGIVPQAVDAGAAVTAEAADAPEVTAGEAQPDSAADEADSAEATEDTTEEAADVRPAFPTEEIPASQSVYEGVYGYYGGLMRVTFRDGDTLSLTVPGVEGYEETYFHVGEGLFLDVSGAAKVSFTVAGGHTYMEVEGITHLPGLGEKYSTQFNSVKVAANPLSGSVKEAWDAREGKSYYVINEKYSSQYHMITPLAMTIVQPEDFPGYVAGMRIIDESTLQGEVQIPGMMGRDLTHVTFWETDGVEYAKDNSSLYISEDGVPEIYKGSYATLTIKEDGYGIWLKAGHVAGRTMTVNVPSNASFAVYDSNGACINFSLASGSNTTELPEGALLLFLGDAGSQFEIYQK